MKLSIAMCTYNGEKFLAQQLQSIFSQTLPVKEIIVCDDNSTDNTINILKGFKDAYPGIFKIIRNNETIGVKKNFEQAISLTTGDIIFLSDQDDIWSNNKVETMVTFLDADEQVLALFTNATLIDEHNNEIEGTIWSEWGFDAAVQLQWKDNAKALGDLYLGNNKITGATLAFKKQLKNYILPFEHSNMLWHDGWIGLKAASLNGLKFINNKLVQYRVHPQQQVGIKNGVIYQDAKPEQTLFKKLKAGIKKYL